MNVDSAMLERVKSHVDRRRLLETAQALIEVPSPTGKAGAVSDRLAQLLEARRIQGRPADGRLPGGSGRGGSARERSGRAHPSVQRAPRHRPSCRSLRRRLRTACSRAAGLPT